MKLQDVYPALSYPLPTDEKGKGDILLLIRVSDPAQVQKMLKNRRQLLTTLGWARNKLHAPFETIRLLFFQSSVFKKMTKKFRRGCFYAMY